MADNNKLELVVEVDANKANASIKSLNTGLSSIEQSAANAAKGASTGLDGMTASMVKGATAGNLLADAIKGALDWAKEWTLDAAKHAAHTDKMGLSMEALAKAHGVASEAAKEAIDTIKHIGFSTQEAIHAVDRLVISDMDLAKSQGLAKLAKDAAAIENITPAEGLEKILLAIESGASRGLRTMGIFVDMNKEVQIQELLTGKTFSENEVRQIRYNAVMREAVKVKGAAAAASESVEAQEKKMALEIEELKESIGTQFLPMLLAFVKGLRELVGYLRENTDGLISFAKGAAGVAAAFATYSLAEKILHLGTAMRGLNAAIAMNPWALGITAVAVGGALAYQNWKSTTDRLETGYEDQKRHGIQQQLMAGKLKLDDVKKMGYTDDQIKEIVAGKRLAQGESFGTFESPLKDAVKPKPEMTLDQAQRIADERRRQGEDRKKSEDYLLSAISERKNAEREQAKARLDDSVKMVQATDSETEATKRSIDVLMFSLQEHAAGVAKLKEDEGKEIESMSTFVDSKSGAVIRRSLSPEVLNKIHAATTEKIAAFDLKFNEEEGRRMTEMWKFLGDRIKRNFEQSVLKPIEGDLELWQQLTDIGTKRTDNSLGYDKSAVQQRKDLQLAQIESIDAITIKAKIYVEQAKTAIETDAIKQRTAIELIEIDRRTEADIRAAQNALRAKGILDDARLNKVADDMRVLGKEEKDALSQGAANEIAVTEIKGATQTRQIVNSEYKSIFDSLKQQAGGVFDALLTKSQSVWSAIGNSLKTALLTAIKDVVTSQIAVGLMSMFVPGANARMLPGGSLGKWGSLFGVGSQVAFGGSGTGLGTGGGGWGGGTFAGPTGTGRAGGGGMGGVGSWANMASGAKGWLSNLGNIGYGPKGGDFGGEVAGSYQGVGGATGGALMLGGAALGFDGLRRGGWAGLGETTAGGAMIGYKFGGVYGAAIGAGIGAVAGMIRMFIKGATEKLKSKIKEVYGIDVTDKDFLQTIADLAKSSFGGNLDLTIRSNQVRDWLMYYKMQTNQANVGNLGAIDNTARGVSLSGYGGAVSQNAVYVGGAGYNYGGSLAPTTPSQTFQPNPAQTFLTLQIDGRDVNASVIKTNTASSGRRESAAILLDPLLTYG
jgi:hypothetical protein